MGLEFIAKLEFEKKKNQSEGECTISFLSFEKFTFPDCFTLNIFLKQNKSHKLKLDNSFPELFIIFFEDIRSFLPHSM